jgi:hypothetical protein
VITLVVGRSWNGEPLAEAEQSTLRIGFERGHDGDQLRIEVDAPFAGENPPKGPVGPTAKLWEHEVVELFVVGADQRYTEIELAPQGHHLVLQLEGIRNIVRSELPIEFRATIDGARWRGSAAIPRALLPSPALTCNAYRVAGFGPTRRWQALVAVPGDRPDFHRLDRFAPWPL